MKETFYISELENALDAAAERTVQYFADTGRAFNMKDLMTYVREYLNGRVWNKIELANGSVLNKKIDMSTYGLRGEDKKILEAAIEQALIDYKKERTIANIPTIAPSEWIKTLHSFSYNIQKEDIGAYILASLKQVWNALLAANVVKGKPYQEILYFESTMQGNGKSTLMKNLYEAARDAGLDAGSTVWPSYGYNNLRSLQSNHMTYINDSTMRDRDVDTEAVMAMIRREEVTTREKYKPEITACAQGAIYAAGNRQPYAQGRGWTRIRFNTIKAEEAAEYFNTLTHLSKNVIKNKSLLYNEIQDFNHLITKITNKINEKNNNNLFENDVKLIKKLKITKSCQHIALIQSLFADHHNIDLTSVSVNQMIKIAKNTSNEIYPQTASNIANELFNLFREGLIERKTRQYDLKYCKYDITPIIDIDLEELEDIPDSDFDIIAACEKEWERWEAIFAEFDPQPTNTIKENNDNDYNRRCVRDCESAGELETFELQVEERPRANDCELNRSVDRARDRPKPEIFINDEQGQRESNAAGVQRKEDSGQCAEDEDYRALGLGPTTDESGLDAAEGKYNMMSFKDITAKLSEHIEKPNEAPAGKQIKIEYTFDDGSTETLIKTREDFCNQELNLFPDDKRPYYALLIERGYGVECRPNPIGAKTIRMTFTDELPNIAITPKSDVDVKEYLKLNGNTDAKTPEEIEWDNLLQKHIND